MRWIWMVVLINIWQVFFPVVAQETSADLFAGAGALSGVGGSPTGSYFIFPPMADTDPGLGMTGSRFSGLSWGSYQLHGFVPMGTQLIGARLGHTGSPALSQSRVLGYYSRKLTDRLSLALGLGVMRVQAKGYVNEWVPDEGIGLHIQLTEQCRWLFQAEGIHRFFAKDKQQGYRIRTGLAYRFSPAISATAEYVVVDGFRAEYLLVFHYQPLDKLISRFGLVSQQFWVSGGWNFSGCWVETGLGWHPVLGLQQNLQVRYTWKKHQP